MAARGCGGFGEGVGVVWGVGVSGVRERDGCLGVRGLLGGAWVGAGGGAVCEGCWGWLG